MKNALVPALSLVALLASPLSEADAHGNRCRTVFSPISFQILPPELCTASPFGLCSEATIHRSPLRGSYAYSVDELSVGAGLSSLPASTLAATGEFVLETRHGTVIGTKTTQFDVTTGEQMTHYSLHSGPYTGTLFASGFFDPTTAAGSKRRNIIWGDICRAE